MHLKYFSGGDKVLWYADSCEKESAFYVYDQNRLNRQKGYYIFYEKNDCMQEYMISQKEGVSDAEVPVVPDKAVKKFRKIVSGKNKEKKDSREQISWVHVACAGAAVLSLAGGLFWMQVQKEPQQVEVPDTEVDAVLVPEVPFPEQEPDEESKEEYYELQPPGDMEDEKTEETAITVYTSYTVREGDTLSKISMRYYGDFSKVMEICKINNMIEDDVIYPGQIILLP